MCFQRGFSVAESRPKSTEGRSKPGGGWRPMSSEFVDDRGARLSSKKERVVLYAIKREPSDLCSLL